MIAHVKQSIERAERFESNLPPDTLPLTGYSGRVGRHFLNNLASVFTPYVEVGCYRGSTLICAAYDNPGLVIGVDNFTDETKPGQYMVDTRRALLDNLRLYSDRARPSIIDAPCWDVRLSGFACCFFDGAHTEQDHADAVTKLSPWFADQFVFVVDDFNRKNVRDGTDRGIEAAKLRVQFYWHKGDGKTDDPTGWWNGFGVYVLQK
jgi:hypothetical protein